MPVADRDDLGAVVALAGVGEAKLERARIRGLGCGHPVVGHLDLERLGLVAPAVVIVVIAAGREAEREGSEKQSEQGSQAHRNPFEVWGSGALWHFWMPRARPGYAWPSGKRGNM